MELVIMALGAICQNYAYQNNLKEPSQSEEMAFVLTCMQRCRANKQNDYSLLDAALSKLKKHPRSRVVQDNLFDTLKAVLVMHVFYDSSVDTNYTHAIDAWFRTFT
jgi:hypothetical protein